MATIVATFDSESKDLKVTVDGVDQGDISYFSCSCNCYEEDGKEEKYGGCSIEKRAKEVNGVTYRESAYAHIVSDVDKLSHYFQDALRRK